MVREHLPVLVLWSSNACVEACIEEIGDNRLEEHQSAIIDGPDFVVNLFVEWNHEVVVRVSELYELGWVLVLRNSPRFIDQLIAEHIGLVFELLSNIAPEVSHFICQTVHIESQILGEVGDVVGEVVLCKGSHFRVAVLKFFIE